MTTIAVDFSRGQIAADGLETWGDQVFRTDARKIVVRSKAVFALSGSSAMIERIIDWEQAGAKDKPPSEGVDNKWTLLAMRADGSRLLYTSSTPYPVPLPMLFAIGSGADYAMGAMRAGKSPREAIEIIRDHRLDVWTGGEIQVVELMDVFARKTQLVKNEKTGKNIVRLEAAGG